jgi:MinD superfamily P-loop ATPase
VILTIASGKGGTGKTTVAVSLAQVAAELHGDGPPVRLLDCDVEAPNAAILLRPTLTESRDAVLPVPEIDDAACDHCGRCVDLCRVSALADLGTSILLFPEQCTGCGVCADHCPRGAIREVPYVLGTLEAGTAGTIAFAQGRLHVGRAQPTPVIRALKQWQLRRGAPGWQILDAPPGASCPVLETARGSDRVLLVTEPTPFGLHDLRKAAGALGGALGLQVGVVINRSRGRDESVVDACRELGLPVVLRIPFRREIAEAYAEGVSLVDALPSWREPLEGLLADSLRGEAA